MSSTLVMVIVSEFSASLCLHSVKYAGILVFSDPYFPAQEENLGFCTYMEKYCSEKTQILANITQY